MVPCPICSVAITPENLSVHLAKIHPGESATTVIRGSDGRASFALLKLLVVVVAVGVIAHFVAPPDVRRTVILAVTAAGSVIGILAVLAFAHVFSARLVLHADRVVLRHTFGLGHRVTRIPCALATGPIMGAENDVVEPPHNGREGKVGTYLRLAGPVPLVLGWSGGHRVATFWTGTSVGRKRYFVDIKISSAHIAVLEYALAARGALTRNAV